MFNHSSMPHNRHFFRHQGVVASPTPPPRSSSSSELLWETGLKELLVCYTLKERLKRGLQAFLIEKLVIPVVPQLKFILIIVDNDRTALVRLVPFGYSRDGAEHRGTRRTSVADP